MCGGNKNQTTKQNQSYTNAASGNLQDLISRATNVSNTAYDPDTEQKVAGWDAYQNQAYGNVAGNQGNWQPYMNQASGYAATGAGGITGDQIAAYQNPYTQQVIDTTMADLNAQNARQFADVQGNAAKLGALGGTQPLVARNLAMESQNRTQNPIIAQLRSQGFDKSLAAAQGDRSAAQWGSQQMASLGDQQQRQSATDAAMLYGMGQNRQQQQQREYDAASQNAASRSSYPFATTQWLSNILNNSASTLGGSTSGSTTKPGGNWWNSILGAAASGTGAYMASDERIKHDIKQVGATFDGMPIYTFKMPGDEASQMGVMAQDVEMRQPEAVADIGGIKHVNYDAIEPFAKGGAVDSDVSRMARNVKHVADAIRPFRQGMASGGQPMLPYANARSYVPLLPAGQSGGAKIPQLPGVPDDEKEQDYSKMGQAFGKWAGSGGGGNAIGSWTTTVVPEAASGGRIGYADGGNIEWVDGQPVFSASDEGQPSFVGAPAPVEPVADYSGIRPYQATPEPEKKESGKRWYEYGSNPGLGRALMAAGFGMMASRSPFVGQAIGEGGMAGVADWVAQKNEAVQQRRAEMEDARMKQAAAQHQAQLTHQKDVLAESIRQHDMQDVRARDQLARQLTPEIVRQLEAAGLVQGTPEFQQVMMRVLARGQGKDLVVEAEARREIAERLGMKPDHPAYQAFIATGKMPREDQSPLTATDKKAILEADEAVLANKAVLRSLDEADKLNAQANQGMLAGARATAGNYLPDVMVPDFVSSKASSQATTNYENVVIGQALQQLKSTFGAAPTEGERKILMDLQGSVNMPSAVRAEILRRARVAAEARLKFNEQRAAEMRGGTYYKPQPGVINGPNVGGERVDKPFTDRLPAPGGAQGAIPPDAVRDLLSNPTPERMRQFDEVFGAGAAQQFLTPR